MSHSSKVNHAESSPQANSYRISHETLEKIFSGAERRPISELDVMTASEFKAIQAKEARQKAGLKLTTGKTIDVHNDVEVAVPPQ